MAFFVLLSQYPWALWVNFNSPFYGTYLVISTYLPYLVGMVYCDLATVRDRAFTEKAFLWVASFIDRFRHGSVMKVFHCFGRVEYPTRIVCTHYRIL